MTSNSDSSNYGQVDRAFSTSKQDKTTLLNASKLLYGNQQMIPDPNQFFNIPSNSTYSSYSQYMQEQSYGNINQPNFEIRNVPTPSHDGLKIVDVQNISNIWDFQKIGDEDPILQCTMSHFPHTTSVLSKSRLPLGLIIHPFPKNKENTIPFVKRTGIVRCVSCRTYLNPFVSLIRRQQWKCNICDHFNKAPEFLYSDTGNDSVPELQYQTVEYLASSEYMIRPPTPAVYVYLLEVSYPSVSSGYLKIFCDTLISNIHKIPSDSRSLISFVCFDEHVHYFTMNDDNDSFNRAIVSDLSEIFLPSPSHKLLINISNNKQLIIRLLNSITTLFSINNELASSKSCLGYALSSAISLTKLTGGRITTFLFQKPNVGPGQLDLSQNKEEFQLTSNFYKQMALECSEVNITVDMFVLGSGKTDLFTLTSLSKNCAGEIVYIPNFNANSASIIDEFIDQITHYIIRPIGFESVLRIRCSRGINVYTFHGNFFLRSTDLLTLPVVNSDATYGVELQLEEDLSRDVDVVFFQIAVLYTNHLSERRIRVHTIALPTAKTLTEIYEYASLKAIVSLVSKMAVSKAVTYNKELARTGMTNVALDISQAFCSMLFSEQNSNVKSLIYLPSSLCAIPACMLSMMKSIGFNTDSSVTPDQRSFYLFLSNFISSDDLLRLVYPYLYSFTDLLRMITSMPPESSKSAIHLLKQLPLSQYSILSTDLYILFTYKKIYIYVRSDVHITILQSLFNASSTEQLPLETMGQFSSQSNWISSTMASFISYLQRDCVIPPRILIIRDKTGSSSLRSEIMEYLYDDKTSSGFSLREFYQYISSKM